MHKQLDIKAKAIFDDLLYNIRLVHVGMVLMLVRIKSIGNGVKFSGTSTDFSDGSITLTSDKMEQQ